MISIIENKPLIYDVPNYDVILVPTSINNALGNGFQYEIKKAFPQVDVINKTTSYGDIRKLGTVQVTEVDDITFCLLYINKGRYRPDLNPDYLDYNALESCIKLINENFKDKKIASTIIGHDRYEGDGNKEKILSIIENNSNHINLTLYDYEQKDREQVRNNKWCKIIDSIGKVSQEEYRKMKIKYHWEETFGLLKPVPDNLTEKEVKQIIKDYKESFKSYPN